MDGGGETNPVEVDLSGLWAAHPANDDLRRTWLGDDLDPAGWEPIPVPGHWRSVPAFADLDGPLFYRMAFAEGHEPTGRSGADGGGDRPADRRAWLVLDGVFYQSDVWLDGAYLGDTEGYFFPHRFEVTDVLAARREHTLGIEVACAPERDRTAKRNITGVFQHWDCADPDDNPGGLWRPVRLEGTGPIAIRHLRVTCGEATAERARLSIRAVLDAAVAGTASLDTTVGSVEHHRDVTLAAGENQLTWTVDVDQPELWWPRAMGDQPLVDLEVVVTAEGAEAPSDRRRRTTGLRQVQMRNWVLEINGERLFLKGANQGPSRMALAEAEPTELTADVDRAVEAGLDLLRIHGHVTRPELYEAADRAGLLVWQDFPLQWGYARGLRPRAVRQAREMVDLLGHHPSVGIWCGHNEPRAHDVEPGEVAVARAGVRAAAHQLPSWNRTVLDRSVRRAITRADRSRPTIPHSGVLPHVPRLDGTDSHLYFGWYHGHERGLVDLARRLPRLVRFVSEFGAQAVPESDAFLEPDRWPDLDWARLERTHSLQTKILNRHVPMRDHPTFASWKAATQAHQATVIRYQIETLRRLKYRPTGGFALFCFADGDPGITWSVLDHDRVPKAGYRALADACRPVITVAERPPGELAVGTPVAWDVHVISDRRHELADARVTADVGWQGGSHRWSWGGDIGADTCERVGTIQMVVPDAAGPLRLDLAWDLPGHPDLGGTATYTSTIVARDR